MLTKKKVLTGLGGAAALLLIGAAAPRAAKAIYTTPVTVYNTTSQPAIALSADKATRIPYQSNIIMNTCGGLLNCGFSGFTAVPPGYRLIVENVSGFFNLQMNSTPIAGYLENINFALNHQNLWGLSAPIGGTGFNGESFAGLNETVNAVFDAGESPFVVIYGNFMNNFPQDVDVTGHLESCSVVTCAPVQH
jgi:hypothetical protein